MTEFFLNNFIAVYFFYGLSFFCMGLAVLLEVGHSSELDFSRALVPLAGFGVSHGAHEWMEMFLIIRDQAYGLGSPTWIPYVRLLLLAVSFLMLVAFGARLVVGPNNHRLLIAMLSAILIIWLAGLAGVVNFLPSEQQLVSADVYTRYSLAIPGAALTVWGLAIQRQKFYQMSMQSFGWDVLVAAFALGLYGGVGQLFASPSAIFPSLYLNTQTFIQWFGFPVQVFRAIMATLAAIFIIRSLRAFEVENGRHIEALRNAQLGESRRLEEVRDELLHRTVKTQESERQRIARELHDETGQTLTALGLGLRGLSETIPNDPDRAVKQAQRLESLSVNGIQELQRIVSGLHPPQLDDLGLLAALRWYAKDISERSGIPVNISSNGLRPNITTELRTVIFRIAQEAITNVVRHASANQISIQLDYVGNEIHLQVVDDGLGFNPDLALRSDTGKTGSWGLLGMLERASLVGGKCTIKSIPGVGTTVDLVVPVIGEMQNA